jgi:hypothetical protein
MFKSFNKYKITSLAILMVTSHVVFASLSLSGSVDEKSKKNKYSLKNINSLSKKSISLSLYRSTLQSKGLFSFGTSTVKSPLGFNSFMQLENSNTTYVLPFKYKFKAPKFKTPSPNN